MSDGPKASNRYGDKPDADLTPPQRRRVRKRVNIAKKRKRRRQAAAKKRAGTK